MLEPEVYRRMGKRQLIKPFSFTEFVTRDWLNPKCPLFEAFGDGLDYAGSDAVSKVGVLFHFDQDWAFLSQFPPTFWKRAFYWRYREGLLRASELREKHPQKHSSAIPDWIPEIRLGERGKTHVFKGIPGKGIYVGYNKFFTTFEKPIKDKPGKMTGTDYGYRPLARTSDDGPAIQEINPYDTTDRARYKDGYIGADLSNPQRITPEFIDDLPDNDPIILGAMHPGWTVERTKDFLKKEPPHTLAGMPTIKDKNAGEVMGNWFRAMGVGLLGTLKVGEEIPDPLTGGTLKIVDLVSPKSIMGQWPGTVGKEGTAWVTPEGKSIQGRVIELKVPVVIRDIPDWTVVQADGKESTKKGGPTRIPVLLSTAVLPKFHIPPAQRTAFADRKGKEDVEEKQKESGGAAGDIETLLKNWDLISDSQKEFIQQNKMDQLTIAAYQADPQGFKERHPEHSAAINYTIGWYTNKKTKGLKAHNLTKDQMKKVIELYVPEDSRELNYTPKYPCVKPENDPKGEFVSQERINGCNGGGLQGEAYDGITQYMVNNLGYKRATDHRKNPRYGVLKMMESALNDLVDTCALLLAIRLNERHKGIYNPELGLTNLDPDLINKPEVTRARRVDFARRFARELEQACLKDTAYGTRRTRKRLAKLGMGMGQEQSLGSGGDDDKVGNLGVQDANVDDKSEPDEHDADFNDEDIFDPDKDDQGTRRREERDRILQGQSIGREQKGWNVSSVDQVARAGWLIPQGFGKWADAFLMSKRNEIATKASPEYAVSAERAKKAMKQAPVYWEEMLKEKEMELADSISDPQKRKEEAARQLEPVFKQELARRHPELYGKLSRDELDQAQAAAKERHEKFGVPETEENPEEDEEVVADGGIPKREMNQLRAMNLDFLHNLLTDGKGDMYGFGKAKGTDHPIVKQIADDLSLDELSKELTRPESVKNFIEQDLKLDRKGANEYFVRIWVALTAKQGTPVSEAEAIKQAQQLGLSPKEVEAKVPPTVAAPTQQPQPVSQQPQQPRARTAAKDIGDLLTYIYEPQQPGETGAIIAEKVRTWLKSLVGAKPALKEYLAALEQKLHQQPNITQKDMLILQLIGDFLEDETGV